MSCLSAHDPQLARLADAIAQRVGPQRFSVWFNNSTRLELTADGLEVAVPNDFISEWIGSHFKKTIQDAAHEVLGCSLRVHFTVLPHLFDSDQRGGQGDGDEAATTTNAKPRGANGAAHHEGPGNGNGGGGTSVLEAPPTIAHTSAPASRPQMTFTMPSPLRQSQPQASKARLRHDLDTFVVGASNQLAYNAAIYVCENPGVQYNPLFIHGDCGLGKTHLLQGLCRKFIDQHPTKRWAYLTGEEFTNEFLTGLRHNKLDGFRRKVRDLDLLVIDDVHFLSGKKATQEEFLHTFNAIEANGRQVVMASDSHPKMIEEFGESLINRFVSGMVVRIDPPNYAMRCEILRAQAHRSHIHLKDDVVAWIARRVTQNVRELEGAMTRVAAHVKMNGQNEVDLGLVQQAMGDLDRQLIAPIRPDNVMTAVCTYFGLEMKDLLSGRRLRTISLARSIAMYLIRRTAKLSFPEIGMRMGRRNHSTVISACRRIEQASQKNEKLIWTSAVGDREEEAPELIQRLEDLARQAN